MLQKIESIEEILSPAQTIETANFQQEAYRVPTCEMSELPKLKVKMIPGYPSEEVRDLEQVEDLPFLDVLVFAEGYRINSYEELVQLAAQDNYKARKFIEVVVLSVGIVDGG